MIETTTLTTFVINAAMSSHRTWSVPTGTKCSTRHPSLCGDDSEDAAAMQDLRVSRVTRTGRALGEEGAASPYNSCKSASEAPLGLGNGVCRAASVSGVASATPKLLVRLAARAN